MSKATYLPPEIIKAIRVLIDYLSTIDCTDIQISYLGGISFLKSNGGSEYISPIAVNMMLINQQEEKK